MIMMSLEAEVSRQGTEGYASSEVQRSMAWAEAAAVYGVTTGAGTASVLFPSTPPGQIHFQLKSEEQHLSTASLAYGM